MKRLGLLAMIALTVLPLAATGFAVLFVLPDAIPLHVGAHGIDAVGSKNGAFLVAFIIAGCGALLTVTYCFMDRLAAAGFVHGTNANGGRVIAIVSQAIIDVMLLLILAWMTFGLK